MTNTWKDGFLKTSLPLEFEVSRLVEKKKFFLYGQYDYVRNNEQGIQAEFSVDLHALKLLKHGRDDFWGNINLLIECKYVHPSANWIFLPITNDERCTIGYITTQDELCSRRIYDHGPLFDFDRNLDFCWKGADSRDTSAETENIKRGIFQLKYAIPDLFISNASRQITTFHDEELYLSFICPILVTNAHLFILKKNVGIDMVKKARSLSSIAIEKEYLVHYDQASPMLSEYIDKKVERFYSDYNGAKAKIEQINDFSINKLKYATYSKGRGVTYFKWHTDVCTDRILVVNINSLGIVIDRIIQSVLNTKLVRVGRLEFTPKALKGLTAILKKA